ncbi:hypothetical protein ACFFX0_18445 [Citricoccus parietis]|uniref:Uncharacterized protein n=1 Tax=Citricoccus parietis TaxID=592307 RepID=A0ABV5G2D3_9MICC
MGACPAPGWSPGPSPPPLTSTRTSTGSFHDPPFQGCSPGVRIRPRRAGPEDRARRRPGHTLGHVRFRGPEGNARPTVHRPHAGHAAGVPEPDRLLHRPADHRR